MSKGSNFRIIGLLSFNQQFISYILQAHASLCLHLMSCILTLYLDVEQQPGIICCTFLIEFLTNLSKDFLLIGHWAHFQEITAVFIRLSFSWLFLFRICLVSQPDRDTAALENFFHLFHNSSGIPEIQIAGESLRKVSSWLSINNSWTNKSYHFHGTKISSWESLVSL